MIGSTARHDPGDRIFADAEVSGDPAIASALFDRRHDFWRKAIRFRSLSFLATEFPAAGLCGLQSRFDAFADQVPLKFGNAGEHGGQHAAVG